MSTLCIRSVIVFTALVRKCRCAFFATSLWCIFSFGIFNVREANLCVVHNILASLQRPMNTLYLCEMAENNIKMMSHIFGVKKEQKNIFETEKKHFDDMTGKLDSSHS